MPRSSKDEYQQLYEGAWYKLDDSYHHQCCGCGLVHVIDFQLKNGVLFQRFTIDTRETAKARRKRVTSANQGK